MARDNVTGRQMVCKVVDISHARRRIQQPKGSDLADDAATADGNYQATKDEDIQRKRVQSIIARLKSYDREFQMVQNLCHVS